LFFHFQGLLIGPEEMLRLAVLVESVPRVHSVLLRTLVLDEQDGDLVRRLGTAVVAVGTHLGEKQQQKQVIPSILSLLVAIVHWPIPFHSFVALPWPSNHLQPWHHVVTEHFRPVMSILRLTLVLAAGE